MADQQGGERQDEQISREIRNITRDGRAACEELLDLARRCNIPPGRIGQLCNEMDIRVAACQLGCFR